MRKLKRKNIKKSTIFTVLLIFVAVLVVGYAVLSSTLSIFGGLSIVGGNNWNVHWDNIEVNGDSTAVATSVPEIVNNNTRVNFTINLNTPGDFYEFNVDAVNSGSVDAMIENVIYSIYDSEDNEVYPEFLYYEVTYVNGRDLGSYHLLEAESSVTYKVRIEYNSDISATELPSGTEAYRFEFGVTYTQADDNAFAPSFNSLPEIPNAFEFTGGSGEFFRLNGNHVRIGEEADLGLVFINASDMPNNGFDFALKHTIQNNYVNDVSLVIKTSDGVVSIPWSNSCFGNTTIENNLYTLFESQCYSYDERYVCTNGDNLTVRISDNNSIYAYNGIYSCEIFDDGESYCYVD